MGLLAFLLGGCSAVASDPHALLEEKAATIDAAAQDLLDSLAAAGLSDASAHGVVDSCQSEPAPGAAYRAGISVAVGDDPAGGFDALSAQLDASGWTPTDDLSGSQSDPSTPSGRFTRDDITLDVTTGGFTSGGVRHGADEMTLGITIADGCVRLADGSDFAGVKDLEKEILPRE